MNDRMLKTPSRISYLKYIIPSLILVLVFFGIGLGLNLDGSYAPAGQKEETAQAYSTGGVYVYDSGDLEAITRGKMFSGTGFEDGAGSGTYSNSSWAQYYNASSGGGTASGWTSKTGQMNSRYQSGSSGNKVVNVYVPKNAYGKYQYNAGSLGFGPCNRITMKIRNNYASASETISYYVGTIDTSGNYNAVHGSSSSYATIGYTNSTNMTSITIDFDNHRQNLKSIFIVVKGTSKDNYFYLDDIQPGWVFKSDATFTLGDSFSATLTPTTNEFYGTMYGNGKTLTLKSGVTSGSSTSGFGDNTNDGVLFGNFHGTIRDCTITWDEVTKLYNYTGSDTNYHNYAGIIAGKMTGGNIYGVTISIAAGKGFMAKCADTSSSGGGGYGGTLGAFAGQVASGTNKIYNCCLTLNGSVSCRSEDYGGNGDEGSNSRAHVGGWIGEVNGGSLEIKSCEMGGTTGVVCAMTRSGTSAHKSNRAGGIIGVVRGSSTVTIDTFDMYWSGAVAYLRSDGASKISLGLLVGRKYTATLTVSNIAMNNNYQPQRIEVTGASTDWPTQKSSLTVDVTHSTHALDTRLSDDEAIGAGSGTVTNSFCYMRNKLYLNYGSSPGYSSDYGEFKFDIKRGDDKSVHQGKWTVQVVPKSGYCASAARTGSWTNYWNASNYYTTYGSSQSAAAFDVTSSTTPNDTTNYRMYGCACKVSKTLYCAGGNKTYNGSGIQSYIYFDNNTAMKVNYGTSNYLYSTGGQGSNGTQVSTSGTTVTTNKGAGSYTIKLVSSNSASGSLVGNNTLIYINGTTAPGYLGFYDGSTTWTKTISKATLTATGSSHTVTYGDAKPSLSVTVTGFVNSETTSTAAGYSAPTASTTYAAGSAYNSSGYAVTVSGGSASNYTFSYTNGKITTNKRSITCKPDNKTINYGASAPTYTYSITSGSKYGSDSLGTASYTCSYTATAGNSNRNAGSYTISMSGLSNSNYTITQSGTGTLTVNKVALTIKADDKSVTYGGAAPSYTTTVSGFKYSETTSVLSGSSSASCSYAAGNAVGTQTITASNTYSTHTNYTFSNSNGTLTIGKKSVTITPSHAAISYGTATPTGDFSNNWSSVRYGSDSLSGTASYSTTYDSTNSSKRSAGSYNITMSGVSNSNYTITFGTGTLTVNKVALTIKADDKSVTYGNAAPSYTVTVSGFKYSETTSVLTGSSSASCSYAAGNAVGSQTITASNTYSTHTNYTFSNSNGTLTIGKRSITCTPENKTINYGDAAPTYSYSITSGSKYGSDNLGTASYTCSYTATAGNNNRNAGSYTISMSGLSNSNYTITQSGTGTLTVNKVALTIKADNKSVTYGGAAPSYTTTVSGFKYSETTSVLSGSSSATCSYAAGNAVGSQTITASNTYATHTNYTFSNSNGTLTIGKKSVTITPSHSAITYGAATPAQSTYSNNWTSVRYGSDALTGTAVYTCAYNGTSGNANRVVKSYDITMSGVSNDNYTITFGTGSLTVNKKAVTVTAADKNITYGDAAPTYTVNYSGWEYSETTSVLTNSTVTYSCSYTATAGNANRVVKTYTITPVTTSLAAANYSFTPANGTLTVNKLEVTVTADNKSVTYGDAAPTYTFSYGSFVYSETSSVVSGSVTYSCTYAAGSAATTYTITPVITGLSADNYSFKAVGGTLTVGKRSITCTPDNKTITYGDAAPTYTYSITSGTKYGSDSLGTASYTCSYNTSAAGTRTATTYTISMSGLSNSNYTITQSGTGTLTVNKFALTVTADNKSITYGAAAPSYTVTVSGYKFSETSSVLSGAGSASCSTYSQGSAATTYTITASAGTLSATNYSFTTSNGTLTVGKKAVTITPSHSAITYGAATPAQNTYSNNWTSVRYGSDTLTGTAVYTCAYNGTSGNANRVVKSYDITMTGVSNSNYTITFGTGSLTVNKKSVTVTAADKNITYGDAAPTYTVNYSGWEYSETTSVLTNSTVTYTCSYSQGNNATTYTITPVTTSLAAANYSFTPANGTLTVGKRTATLSWTNTSLTYNGTAQKPTCTVTNKYSSDTCNVTVSGEKTDAGNSYTATATALSNTTNYQLPAGTTQTFSIAQKAVTITAVAKSSTYGSAATALVNPTVSPSGAFYARDSITLGNSMSTTISATTDQGTYTITPTATGTGIGNYTVTPVTANYTVGKATLTLSWTNTSKTYNGSAQGPSVSISSGVKNSDSLTISANTPGTNVGDYTATATLSGTKAGNYTFTATKSFTITAKAVTITAVAKSSTYGSAATALVDPTVSPSGAFYARDSITLGNSMATTISATTAKGTYTITPTATGTGIGNYTVTPVTANYTVNALTATLSWGTTTFTYNGSAKLPTCNVSNTVNSDTCTVTVTPSANPTALVDGAAKNAGTYTATASALSNSNYALPSSKSTSFTISRAYVTVPTVTIYNDGATTGTTISAGGTENKAYNGKAYSFNCATNNSKYTKSGGSNITNYSSSGSTLTLAVTSNYYWGSSGTDSTDKTFKIMVTKVALSVTASANSITYGAAPAANGYTITGFVNSETSSVVSGSVTYTYNYSQYGDVGSYTITPVTTGLSATNYSFTPVGGTLTVGQKEIGLSWGSTTSWVYDGSSHAPTCSATGNVNSDSIGITVTGGKTAVGSYTATASAITGTKAGNYKLPAANTCAFSITRAYVTIPTVTIYNNGTTTSTTISAGGSQSKTYNAKAYTLNYSTPSGASASATNSNTMTSVGSIVLTFTIDGNHYWKTSGGVSSGTDTANKVYTLNVTAKSISGATVTLGATYSYNGSSRTQSVSSVTIDGLAATFSTSNNVQTNAGNYELTVTGTGNFTGTQTKAWSIARAYVTVPTVTIYKGGVTTGTTISAGTTEDVDYDGSEYTFNYTADTSKYTATGGSAITSKGTSTLTLSVTSNYYWGSSGSDAADKSFSIHVTTGGAVIVLAHAAITYGDAKPTSGFTATLKAALAGGENLTGVTINQSDFNVTSYSAGSNKGSYTITISGTSKSNIEARLSNYDVEYEGSLSVGQKSLTLSWTNTSKAYTGLAQGPSVSISSGKYGSDDVTVSCDKPRTTVGSATATATLGGDKKANYTMSNGTTTFTVTKAPLTVTANANTITYGSAPAANGYTITGFVNSETDSVVTVSSVSYNYNYSQYGAVGSYTITPVVTGFSATNYSFSAAAGTLTVSPKAATVTAANKSTTYGSAAPAFTYTTSGLVNSDTLSGTISYACDYTATAGNANRVVKSGGYSITPSGLSNSNYTITFTAGTLTVNKKTVTVTWGTKSWTYDASSHRPTATIGGTAYSESVSVSTYGGDTQVNVGASYPVSVTAISDSSNYQLPTDGSAATTFSITAATLTVKADDKSVTYGAAVPSYTSTITGYKGSDTASVITGNVTYSCSYAQYSAVNTYTITPVVTGLSATNYTFSASSGTLTVSAKAATVTADNKTITYGAAKPTFTYSTSGLVNSDTLSGTISYACAYTQTQGNANSVAKDYSITPSGLSNGNYTITFTAGTLTVNKKAVTLSWSASSYVYDGSTHLPTATVTAGSKGYSGDTVTVATYSGTTSAQTNAGNYTTTAASLGGTSGGNYTLTGGTNVSKSWSITAKAVTVTVNNASVTYGSAKPSFTNNWDDVKIGSDTLSGTASYTCAYTATAGNANRVVGTYDVTLSGLSNSNYSITFAKGTLTVTQKTVGLTWGALSFTYDGNNHRPVVTAVTDTAYSETVSVSTYSGSQQMNVGTGYTVTATALNNSNYKLPTTASVVTKSWSITAASVTVTWSNTSLTYNGNEQSPSVAITAGNLDGENLTVSTSAALTNVSSMTATATLGGSAAGNYTIGTGATHSFAITALNISGATITLTTGSFTYDGSEKTVSISSITKNGLNVTYDYTSGRKGTAAGNYTLTVTGNGNFTGTATKGWSIGKKSITGATITLASSSFAYDRTEKTVTISSVVKDTLTVTYDVTSGASGTDVNTYTLTITGNGNFTGTATKTWSITAKEIQLTWSNTSRVYSGSPQSPSVALKSGYVISGDTVTVSTSASLTNVSSTTATATLGGASAGNYTIKTSDKTHSFEITPKTLTFSITASTSYTYNGGNQGATVELVSGLVGSEKIHWTMRNSGETNWTFYASLAVNAERTTTGDGWTNGQTTSYGGVNVGSYGITIVALADSASGSAANYQIGGTTTKTWSITPASVTVTAKNHSITYGAAPTNNGFTYGSFQGTDTSSVVSGGVDYTYSYTQYGNVGSYTITPNVSALRADNYTFTAVSGTLTVNALTATLSWGETSFVYSGTTQTPTCSVTNAVNGDELGVTVTGGQKNVGTGINATASAITGTKAGNYALPASPTTTYSIAATPLSVSANNFNITYGDAAPTYTAAFDGFVGGETSSVLGGTPTFSCDYTATSGNANRVVGSYEITVSGYTSSNYDITFYPGTLSVAQKKLPAFTWGTSEWTYDGASHRATVSAVNGKCYSDTVTIAGYDLAAQTAAGQYTISVTGLSGADAGNYTMPDVPNKTFEIKKANVSISVTSYTGLTYTAAAQTVFSVTVSGLQNGETLGFVYTGISGSPMTRGNGTQTFSKTAADTYTISFTGITDGTGDVDNYNLTALASGTTIINKATLSWANVNYSAYNTVTWSAPTGAVGGDTLTYSYSVKKGGTEKLASSSATTFTPAEAGTFVLAVTVGGTNAANYNALTSRTLRTVYSVTFQDNASEHTETPTVLSSVTRYVFAEKKAPAPNWSVTEYEFKGWKNAGVLFDVENTSITSNLTLTASWKIFSWDNITFKLTTSTAPSAAADYTISFTLDSVRRSLDLDEVSALGFKKSGWFNAITWCRGDVTCATNACTTVEEIGADNVTMYGKLSLALKTYDLDGSGEYSAADATLFRKYLIDAEGYGITGLATVEDMYNCAKAGGTYSALDTYCLLPLMPLNGEEEYSTNHLYYMLSALDAFDLSISLSGITWDAVARADGYKVSVNGGAWSEQTGRTIALSTTPGTYSVKVKAYNATSESAEVSITYTTVAVALSNITVSGVTATWTATALTMYKKLDSAAYASTTDTSYTFTSTGTHTLYVKVSGGFDSTTNTYYTGSDITKNGSCTITKLTAPSLAASNGGVGWDAVSNATRYEYSTNGGDSWTNLGTTRSIAYSTFSTTAGEHSILVRAVGNGTTYLTSDSSDEFTYETRAISFDDLSRSSDSLSVFWGTGEAVIHNETMTVTVTKNGSTYATDEYSNYPGGYYYYTLPDEVGTYVITVSASSGWNKNRKEYYYTASTITKSGTYTISTLGTPSITTPSAGATAISWTSVTNATGYEYSTNGGTSWTSTTARSVNMSSTEGTHTLLVRATSSDPTKLTSNNSNTFTYVSTSTSLSNVTFEGTRAKWVASARYVQVKEGSASYATTTLNYYDLTSLSAGSHTVTVKAYNGYDATKNIYYSGSPSEKSASKTIALANTHITFEDQTANSPYTVANGGSGAANWTQQYWNSGSEGWVTTSNQMNSRAGDTGRVVNFSTSTTKGRFTYSTGSSLGLANTFSVRLGNYYTAYDIWYKIMLIDTNGNYHYLAGATNKFVQFHSTGTNNSNKVFTTVSYTGFDPIEVQEIKFEAYGNTNSTGTYCYLYVDDIKLSYVAPDLGTNASYSKGNFTVTNGGATTQTLNTAGAANSMSFKLTNSSSSTAAYTDVTLYNGDYMVATGRYMLPASASNYEFQLLFNRWKVTKFTVTANNANITISNISFSNSSDYVVADHDEYRVASTSGSTSILLMGEEVKSSATINYNLTAIKQLQKYAADVSPLFASIVNVKQILSATYSQSIDVISNSGSSNTYGTLTIKYIVSGTNVLTTSTITVKKKDSASLNEATRDAYSRNLWKEISIEPHEVILAGSSSMEKWERVGQDMKGITFADVGIGGTVSTDWSKSGGLAERLIYAYNPRAVILFVGVNDLKGGSSVSATETNVQALLTQIHNKLPNAKVYYVLINKVPLAIGGTSGNLNLDNITAFNTEMVNYASTRNWLTTIALDTEYHMVYGSQWAYDFSWSDTDNAYHKNINYNNNNNYGKTSFFDSMHLNQAGYTEWAYVIRKKFLALDGKVWADDS